MSGQFEFFEHTADIGARVVGDDYFRRVSAGGV
jgi:SHS2 domain-containing protein